MTEKHVDIHIGRAAYEILANAKFVDSWTKLHEQCAYATGFQTPPFVCTWFSAYNTVWEPVIVSSTASNGVLEGLWLLAYDRDTQVLTHAGANQAEYHVWLALPGTEVPFLTKAWGRLQQYLSFNVLRFKYLPAVALVDTLSAVPQMQPHLSIQIHRRPLLVLNSSQLKASFAKKSNKSRLNRLKKLGTLEFRRINDLAELDSVIGDIIACYDLRQGGINGVTPFHDDRFKRGFYTALFAASDETEVTITYLNGKAIAAFWGMVSGSTVHLGMLVHSPLLAEHSPGKIHIMQLSDHLLQSGKEVLDLTPGGDAWKERFANSHDEVADVTLYRSRLSKETADKFERMLRWAKYGLSYVGLTPSDVREVIAKLGRVRLNKILQRVKNWAVADREFRLYYADKTRAERFSRDVRVSRNSFSDLLCFQPSESWQNRNGFLSTALARLEGGSSVYTICINGRLAHYGWMNRNQTVSYMTEVAQEIEFPKENVCLFDFYTHPDFRGQGLYRATLQTMMRDAFTDDETQHCFISVLADNRPSRRVIEDLGFEYKGSFYWKQRMGRRTKWSDPVFTLHWLSNA